MFRDFPAPLLALALAAFAIGTTEFVIMGLLPQVADSLAVSIPTAGWLVSGYALGVFIGAPIMAVATQSLPPRRALMALMGIFILGNALCAIAPGYEFLMVARVVTALCHGAFFGIGSVEAASLVAPNKRAQAVALMFTGLTLANVLGVPLGTALGQAMGWRTTFWAVTVLGVLALAGLYVLLPRHEAKAERPNMMREFGRLTLPVWLALSVTVISSASIFAIFTYIAPLLGGITHVSPRGVSYTLFIIGLGLTIGNYIGGRLADWRVTTTLVLVFTASAVILAGLTFTAHYLIPAEITLLLWAICAFSAIPALQINLVNLGREAPNLISTLNIAAFNAGNALGAWVGGQVIAHGFGFNAIPPTAAVLALAALPLCLLAHPLAKRI
jgi:DHA1 family inner membrane transport protein